MLVLALDTTTRAGSSALARDGVVLREQPSDPSREPASRLPGDLSTLVEREHVALAEIDVFAVATGPGSFTGLRVGIATMQGLAFALDRPLIGVSAFEALAVTAGSEEQDLSYELRVATWIDAWRGEIYAALYVNGGAAGAPTVEHPTAVLARLTGRRTVFVGDGAVTYRDLILRTLGADARFAEPPAPLLAGTIATLATAAARAGHRPPPHAIRPLYVRRSDAELARR
jgi:tRNA threonylcarbamoyladenosine biosynthesis protein TsaB